MSVYFSIDTNEINNVGTENRNQFYFTATSKNLTEMSDTGISIHHQQYIDGNNGINFDIETINRLSKLNLGVDIDQYIFGNELKSVI